MNGTAPSGLAATVSPWQEELHRRGPGTCWRDAGAQPTSPGGALGRCGKSPAAPRGKNPPRPAGDLRRVADMPEAASARPRSHLTLNSDGQRHPLENSLSVFTLVTGLGAFAAGWVVSLHLLATVAGLASLAVGLYAQLISATRPERMIIVTGLVAAFVGVALGLGHGGFSP